MVADNLYDLCVGVFVTEDFSQHPQTIGDIRSNKSQNAKDWSVRDALIRTLREIDSGELDADKIVMVIAYKRSPEQLAELPSGACEWGTMTRQAGTQNVYDSFGLLAWGQHVMAHD